MIVSGYSSYFESELRKSSTSVDFGNASAMTNLGLSYARGGLLGLGKDEAEAMRWFRKAADLGDARAMTQLGFKYQLGAGG